MTIPSTKKIVLYLITIFVLLGLLATTQPSQAQIATANSRANGPRRANIPYFADEVDWAKSTILWYGINELGYPGKNYVDIRLAYTAAALEVRVTVIDYYLWYNTNPQSGDDLREYDAAVIYLDTNHDRASQPQSDDYMLLSGARHFPNDNAPQYHRDARGNGSGWDSSWTGNWLDASAMQWGGSGGPNDNGGNIDYGWYSYFTIPWSELSLSGPPTEGTLWGLGLHLHDRDDNPPAGAVDPQFWPETFQTNSPSTWGEIHFGEPSYTPETTTVTGSAEIRATSPTDNTVEDAWMGGGGLCSGGHEGGSEINHGDSPELYTGSESSPTHFPCFNKSFLRFQIDGVIPPGVEIVSAELTLHHWGNAAAAIAPEFSQIHLFTVSDDWDEMVIHWNNAPLAQENIALTAVETLEAFPGWPGIAYDWDATQAVAEAYEAGVPVNLAMYSSDVGRDTSKYFVASEAGDWNAEARPVLKVSWGLASPSIEKTGSQHIAQINDILSYNITWAGNNQSQSLVDQLPAGLGTPTNIQVSVGTASYDQPSHQIRWQGTPGEGQSVVLTYQIPVEISGPATLVNTATLSDNSGPLSSDNYIVFVDPHQTFLPCLLK